MPHIFEETIQVNNNIILTQFPGSNNSGDNDNKRESIIQFKGFDSNIQEGVLGSITTSHSGSLKDHKGKIKFNINDGSSTNNLHNIMTINISSVAINSTLDVTGATSLATAGGVVNIASTDQMTTIKGTLNVDEAVTLDTTLDVTGDTSLSSLNTSGAVTFKGNGASITGGMGLNIFLGNIPPSLGSATKNLGVGIGSLNDITGTGNTAGTQNTAIGYNSGNRITTGTNNTCIGYEANTSSKIIENEFTLGNSDVSTLRCADQTIASLSDGRDKTNIVDSTYGLDFVNSLRPVQFTWNKRVLVDGDESFSKNGKDEIGFIAQEFQSVMPNNENDILELVYESNPDRLEARYGKLIPILTKAIQDLSGIVNELNEKIKKLEK